MFLWFNLLWMMISRLRNVNSLPSGIFWEILIATSWPIYLLLNIYLMEMRYTPCGHQQNFQNLICFLLWDLWGELCWLWLSMMEGEIPCDFKERMELRTSFDDDWLWMDKRKRERNTFDRWGRLSWIGIEYLEEPGVKYSSTNRNPNYHVPGSNVRSYGFWRYH